MSRPLSPIVLSVRDARPVQLVRSTFAVWHLLSDGRSVRTLIQAQALPEIEREFATEAMFGGMVFVRETETLSRRSTLHAYRVRRGKWAGGYADARKVYPYTADKLFAMEINAFDPVEPWNYVPGCDVIGLGNVIEGART